MQHEHTQSSLPGHITKDHDVDDAMDALIYECDERGAKLDRDFALLCKEYGLVTWAKMDTLYVTKREREIP